MRATGMAGNHAGAEAKVSGRQVWCLAIADQAALVSAIELASRNPRARSAMTLGPFLTVLLSMLMAAVWTGAGRAADPPSVMIVLDGSGSMWGQIDGSRTNKLALVRDNMRRGARQGGARDPRRADRLRASARRLRRRRGDAAGRKAGCRAHHGAARSLQPERARSAGARIARGGEVDRRHAGPAQPGADPRRCRQLPGRCLRRCG